MFYLLSRFLSLPYGHKFLLIFLSLKNTQVLPQPSSPFLLVSQKQSSQSSPKTSNAIPSDPNRLHHLFSKHSVAHVVSHICATCLFSSSSSSNPILLLSTSSLIPLSLSSNFIVFVLVYMGLLTISKLLSILISNSIQHIQIQKSFAYYFTISKFLACLLSISYFIHNSSTFPESHFSLDYFALKTHL